MNDMSAGSARGPAVEIIPAVMPQSLSDLSEKFSRVKGLVPRIQIDVMDGVFVPEKSWPYTPGGPQEFAQFSDEREGLPFWDILNVEVDLMVGSPESVVDDWARAGASRVIIHIESTKKFDDTLAALSRMHAEGDLGGLGIEIGIALNTTTPLAAIEPYLRKVSFIQCMGIAAIGYQGQPFDTRVLEHIRDLRAHHRNLIISVDGGVTKETAPLLVRAGANRLVAGSAIFGADDTKAAIEALQSAATI